MDLFELADDQSTELTARYEKAMQGHADPQPLQQFASLVLEEWAISLNMKPWDLHSFLSAGEYRNTRQVKQRLREKVKKAGGVPVPMEDAVKRQQWAHYGPRRTFESTFDGGEEFKYGALNIGGLGATRYGRLCAVIAHDSAEEWSSLCFLEHDSLTYVDGTEVKTAKLNQEIANRGCVHMLATLKHFSSVSCTPCDAWPSILCSHADYVDTITTDSIPVCHISCVRVTQDRYDDFLNCLDKLYLSVTVPNFEKYKLSMVAELFELMENNGIKWEVVD